MTTNRTEHSDTHASARDVAGLLVLVLGLGFAGVSAYWAAGGTALLDTVGGVFQRAGRTGGAAVSLGMWLVVAAKLAAAILPVLVIREVGSRPTRRRVRRLARVSGWLLTGYGLALTGGGLLVQVGILHASAGADVHAMAWHTALWDPWILALGLLTIVALRTSRPGRPGTTA